MRIAITKDDILKAKQGGQRSETCPVVWAIKRALKLAESNNTIRVTSYSVFIGGKEVLLPDDVKKFIENFDFLNEAKPSEFDLDLE